MEATKSITWPEVRGPEYSFNRSSGVRNWWSIEFRVLQSMGNQWRIQDFPEGVCQPMGMPTYYLANFSQKLHANEDIWAKWGCVFLVPVRSANGNQERRYKSRTDLLVNSECLDLLMECITYNFHVCEVAFVFVINTHFQMNVRSDHNHVDQFQYHNCWFVRVSIVIEMGGP